MFSALLYLQYHSVKNRILMRLKRLKQPKYLFGALVGGLYFYFYFFRYAFGMRGLRPGSTFLATPETLGLIESAGALMLLVAVLLAWIIPHQRAALTFTEAEVAFLFPAPITRRGLIHFKLLRSQTAILFTTLLLTLFTNRFGGHVWIRVAGWWLILSTLNLHFLGSSFALTMLLDRGITNWQRRLAILAGVLVLVGSVVLWARQSLPGLDLANLKNAKDLKEYALAVASSGPLPWLLFPFRLVVAPFLAPNALAFFKCVGPALGLLLLHYAWVVRSDVAFEEASVESSKRLAEKVAAMRAGNWQAARQKPKIRRPPFNLRPAGPPAVALLWKNLISAGQAFTWRLWFTMAIFAVCASLGFGHGAGSAGLRSVLGMLVVMLLAWSLLIGQQLFRQDFRQDLAVADILKTFPLRGWQLALGELLAPALILTAIQWVLLIVGLGLFLGIRERGLGTTVTLALGFAAAVLAPILNLITLQIPNAAVLLFPSWFQVSKGGGQGIEVTGQRLIFMFGQMLVMLVALLPAAALFAGIFFLGKMLLNIAAGIVLASLAAALVLALEAALGVALLGWLFERFDVAAEAV
jgi:ABC-2 type transport system permease protein